MTLSQSTVSGNTAVQGNGGLGNYGGTLTLVDSTVTANAASGAGGLDNDGGTLTLIDSTVSENPASSSNSTVNTATPRPTESAVSSNIVGQRNVVALVDSGSLTLVDGIVVGNAALNDAGTFDTTNLTLTISAISGESAGVGNQALANENFLTPGDNVLPGRSAGDNAVPIETTSNWNSSAGTNIQTTADRINNTGVQIPADGILSIHSPADERDETGMLSGQSQETMSLRNWVNPAWERAASKIFSESNAEDGRAERFVLLDREGFIDHQQDSQSEWTAAELAGLVLLLPWIPIGILPLDDQSARQRWLLKRDENPRLVRS
jgi:hypothetical protein